MAHLVGNICDMLSNFNILEYESVTNDPFTVYLLQVNLKIETWSHDAKEYAFFIIFPTNNKGVHVFNIQLDMLRQACF